MGGSCFTSSLKSILCRSRCTIARSGAAASSRTGVNARSTETAMHSGQSRSSERDCSLGRPSPPSGGLGRSCTCKRRTASKERIVGDHGSLLAFIKSEHVGGLVKPSVGHAVRTGYQRSCLVGGVRRQNQIRSCGSREREQTDRQTDVHPGCTTP